MKPLRAKAVLPVCLVFMAVMLGCARKKQVTAAPPPPSPVPEATPQPQPDSQTKDIPGQAQTQPPGQGTPPPVPVEEQPSAAEKAEPEKAEPEKAEKAKAKNGKAHSPGKKPASGNGRSAETARNVPPKTVVKPEAAEPSPTAGQISSNPSQSAPPDQATTEQLLQTTETNLTGIKRQLSQEDEVMVSEIKGFVGRSRQAIKENDLVRAHDLAVKAHLLCDDLMKRR